jgi:hypothetical protein
MWSSAADIDILRAEINFSYASMVDTVVGARASGDLPLFPWNAVLTISERSVERLCLQHTRKSTWGFLK